MDVDYKRIDESFQMVQFCNGVIGDERLAGLETHLELATLQAEFRWMRLKTLTHRCDDSLPELAEDMESLAKLAYPNAALSMLELWTKVQFIDAVSDEEMID